jgi:integrase
MNYWTDTEILNLPPACKGKDHIIWHPSIHRFGVRIRESGVRTYVLRYSASGKTNTHTIARVGQISLTEAEKRAQTAWGGLMSSEKYKNPNLERKRQQALHSDLFETWIDDFLESRKRARKSESHIERQGTHLREYFKPLHGIPILQIDRGAVSLQLRRIEKGWIDARTQRERGGNIASSLARATLSTYFNWLIGEGYIKGLENNPVEKTNKNLPAKKTRWLTPAEIAIVWNATDETTQFGRIVRLLILTGARREQIGGLRKGELKLDQAMIVLPPKGVREGGSKNDQEFEIPLSRQALRVLELEESRGGVHFFGSRGGGFGGWSKAMIQLYKRIGDQIPTPWTLHDLRRTVVTNMLKECGLMPHVVDAVINHKPEFKSGVAGIYQQHNMLTERVAAMNVWGDYVERITTPTPRKPDLRIVA